MTLTNEYIDKRIEERVQAYFEAMQPLWTLEDLKKKLNVKSDNWAKDLLNHPPYKSEIESFVHYPSNRRDPYLMKPVEMNNWINENFERIYEERSIWRVS